MLLRLYRIWTELSHNFHAEVQTAKQKQKRLLIKFRKV
jgi:hypothetical protein